ncbi:18843_t:CDS:2, partial [Gigaspora rosea]
YHRFRSTKIHLAWTRAFAICGIPWNIIENSFFIEALKETNLSYIPPTCKFLAGEFLANKINEILYTVGIDHFSVIVSDNGAN